MKSIRAILLSLLVSEPADPSTIQSIVAKRHTYTYSGKYGSPKIDETSLPAHPALSNDGLVLTLDLGPLKEKYLHLLDLRTLRSATGANLLGDKVWYQVNQAPK